LLKALGVKKMRIFQGLPYPVKKDPRGYFYSQEGVDQIKSDILVLLLTNPGERVMNLDFGTPLRSLLFEPNDPYLQTQAKNMIIKSIKSWEPRIAVQNIEVTSSIDKSSINNLDNQTEIEHILFIRIIFVDPQDIKQVQELTLEVPLGGS
jgi:phage baseplate assembly protein W